MPGSSLHLRQARDVLRGIQRLDGDAFQRLPVQAVERLVTKIFLGKLFPIGAGRHGGFLSVAEGARGGGPSDIFAKMKGRAALFEFHDHVIDLKAGPALALIFLTTPLRSALQDVFHLHRLDRGQRLTFLHLVALSTAIFTTRPGIGQSRNFEVSGGSLFQHQPGQFR
jgi:hypothetical protein